MTSANREDIRSAVRLGLALTLSTGPFALLFGAVAVGNGLSIAEATLMSATVYAGASQLVGVELFNHHVAPWVVVLSIFAVNFRHVLYSAAIAKHIRHFSFLQKATGLFFLTDPQFAEAERRGDAGTPVSFAWYLAFGLSVYIPWVSLTVVGGILGNLVGDPRAIGLDVILPVYFMALVLGFRKRPNWLPVVAASAAAAVIAQHFVGSPWHVSLGAIAGVVVGALMPLDRKDGDTPLDAAPEGEV